MLHCVEFSHFKFEYLHENEFLRKTISACLSGAQMSSIHEKRGRKSRDTAPLKRQCHEIFYLYLGPNEQAKMVSRTLSFLRRYSNAKFENLCHQCPHCHVRIVNDTVSTYTVKRISLRNKYEIFRQAVFACLYVAQ